MKTETTIRPKPHQPLVSFTPAVAAALVADAWKASPLGRFAAVMQVFGLCFWITADLEAAPIRVHPANPHYFEFRGEPTLLITSAEHYGAVINAEFDWERYLQTLARDGMNYTRVFAGSYVEGEQDIDWMRSSNTLAPRPGKLLAPWARSDVAGYHNGGNKFDLDRWDDRYFARLKGFVRSAGQQGVVVEITLFGNQYGDSQWAHSPLKASNNIQGIGGRWEDFQTLRDPELTKRQEAMVRTIVYELRDADNVIYEISNEPFNNGVDPTAVNQWHRQFAAAIAKEEKALGVKHLMAANEAVHDDPNVSVLNWHYVANLARLDDEYALGKPIVLDETNGSLIHAGVDDVRVEAWEWICGGGAGYNNLSWEFTPNDPTGTAGATIRRQLKVLREFASNLDLLRMKPAPEIISRPLADGVFARALVEPGETYWVYLHHSAHRRYGTFVTGYEAQPGTHRDSLELALPPGRYRVQWFRPRDGEVLREDRVNHEGAKLRLASPDYDDADITAVIHSETATGAGATKGPLRIHPTNPRYFTDGTTNRDGSRKAVYLTGSWTWASLQDHGPGNPPAPFDFTGYLDSLQKHNHNFFKFSVRENARWAPEKAAKDFYFAPMPYARTGPGSALDEAPKFNLGQFNQDYFDRLRQRAMAARDRGIYVAITLFQGWSVFDGTESLGGANPWRGHFFQRDNNVNGVDGDLDGDGQGYEVHTLGNPAVTRYQEAYVRKVIDTVNDLDNVLYEIANESHDESDQWQYHMIQFIRACEAGKPKQHPIGMTGGWDNNPALFASPADWISPGKEDYSKNTAVYRDDPPPNDGRKVILNDTDHLGGGATLPSAYVVPWVWKSFTRGHNPILMDRLPNSDVTDGSKNQLMPALRAALGQANSYARRVNLAAMVPRDDLSATRYCLANPGMEYLVYQPDGGETFSMEVEAGAYRLEWFDPRKGDTVESSQIKSSGGLQQFKAPFEGDAVLYLRALTER